MRADFYIARRYLIQKREIGFITLISYFSIIGLMLGVAALVVTLAILDGFEEELRTRIIGFESHVTLETFHNVGFGKWDDMLQEMAALPVVQSAGPYIEKEAMLRVGRIAEGVILRGVEDVQWQRDSGIAPYMVAGEFRLAPSDDTGREGIVLGKDLYDRLGLALGDRVIALHHRLDTGMPVQPLLRQFTVTGVYETGFPQYDDLYAYIPLAGAQRLFDMPQKISAIAIRLKDPSLAGALTDEFNNSLDYPFYANTWFDMHNVIFRWLRTQRLPMMIIFGMIIVVGVFNLASSLVMIVVEKRRDIGVLKAMGASSGFVLRIFMIEGLLIGLAGVVLGSALGYGLCWLQMHYRILSLDKGVYFLNFVPVSLNVWNFVVIGVAALAVCALATVIPALRASRLAPVDAIRDL